MKPVKKRLPRKTNKPKSAQKSTGGTRISVNGDNDGQSYKDPATAINVAFSRSGRQRISESRRRGEDYDRNQRQGLFPSGKYPHDRQPSDVPRVKSDVKAEDDWSKNAGRNWTDSVRWSLDEKEAIRKRWGNLREQRRREGFSDWHQQFRSEEETELARVDKQVEADFKHYEEQNSRSKKPVSPKKPKK